MIKFECKEGALEARSPAHLIHSMINLGFIKLHLLPAYFFNIKRIRTDSAKSDREPKTDWEPLTPEIWNESPDGSSEIQRKYKVEVEMEKQSLTKQKIKFGKGEMEVYLLTNTGSFLELKLALMEELNLANDIEIKQGFNEISEENFAMHDWKNRTPFDVKEIYERKEASMKNLKKSIMTTMAEAVSKMEMKMDVRRKREENEKTEKLMKMLFLTYRENIQKRSEMIKLDQKTIERVSILKAKTELLERKLPSDHLVPITINNDQRESTFELEVLSYDIFASEIIVELRILIFDFDVSNRYVIKFFVNRSFVSDTQVPTKGQFKDGKLQLKIAWTMLDRNPDTEISFRVYQKYVDEIVAPPVYCLVSQIQGKAKDVYQNQSLLEKKGKSFSKFKTKSYDENLEEMGNLIFKTIQHSMVNSGIPELKKKAHNLDYFNAAIMKCIKENLQDEAALLRDFQENQKDYLEEEKRKKY